MSKKLSVVPYFGGKARMSEYISSRLDYATTKTFIELFGGGCRVLLNKPQHIREQYNDLGEGICSIIYWLTDPERADEFIQHLYNMEISIERFNEAVEFVESAESDLIQESIQKVRKNVSAIYKQIGVYLKRYGILKNADMAAVKCVLRHSYTKSFELKQNSVFWKFIKVLHGKPQDEQEEIIGKVSKLLTECQNAQSLLCQKGEYLKHIDNHFKTIELAINAYICLTQSRDGMGKAWSAEKTKNPQQYRKKMLNLYDCAERLQGVTVMTVDAMAFLKPTTQKDKAANRPLLEWLNQEDVMVYADPSYIKPEDETEALDGVDWEHEDNLTEAIILNRYIKNRMVEFRKGYLKNKSGILEVKTDTYEQAIQKRCRKILTVEYAEHKKRGNFKFDLPRNLGSIYAASFSYAEHENFLRTIQDCKCKMMVSNYDLVLYNKYLKDWRRDEFITTTSVGMQKANTRVEVIWYNY